MPFVARREPGPPVPGPEPPPKPDPEPQPGSDPDLIPPAGPEPGPDDVPRFAKIRWQPFGFDDTLNHGQIRTLPSRQFS